MMNELMKRAIMARIAHGAPQGGAPVPQMGMPQSPMQGNPQNLQPPQMGGGATQGMPGQAPNELHLAQLKDQVKQGLMRVRMHQLGQEHQALHTRRMGEIHQEVQGLDQGK